MKVILFHATALTRPHSFAMKNRSTLFALLPLEYWQARWRASSRQYGMPANVGRRKWRKYKALMAFGETGGIDSRAALHINRS